MNATNTTLLWGVGAVIWTLCFAASPTLPEFACVLMSSLLAWKSYTEADK